MTPGASGALQRFALAILRAQAERGARVGWFGTPSGPLRFAVRGPEDAPPLLVLHGLGDSLAGWARVAGSLARRHRVHLIDLPGHGLSGLPPDWRLSTLADAVAHYARHLRAPAVVGHSLGAWIALRLLSSGSLRPARLALVNPAGALLLREEWEPFRELVSARDRNGARRYLERAFHRAPLALRIFLEEVIEAMQAEAVQGFLGAVREPDFLRESELSSLRVPAHLVFGERDRLLPEGARPFFRRALTQAEVTILPRCGHLPHFEAPVALAAALLAGSRRGS